MSHPFPRLRILALIWLLIYLPSYTAAYGVMNFLFLCNLGVMVTALGLIVGNHLLVSSQAVAAPVRRRLPISPGRSSPRTRRWWAFC